MVRAYRSRHPLSLPRQDTLLKFRGERVVHSYGIHEPTSPVLYGFRLVCRNVTLHIHQFAFHQFSPSARFSINAFFVALNVNSSASRGRFPTIGLISQPSPGGILRVSDTASHSICNPPRTRLKL